MSKPRRAPGASFQRIDGEPVLLSSDGGELLGLNEVGARVFELSDGTRTSREIAAAVAREFSVEEEAALRDVDAFLIELSAARLVELP